MCCNCPDFIDYCNQGSCYDPDGGMYSKYAKFYIGDTYCEHLKAHYGHDIATWADRGYEEDCDEDS